MRAANIGTDHSAHQPADIELSQRRRAHDGPPQATLTPNSALVRSCMTGNCRRHAARIRMRACSVRLSGAASDGLHGRVSVFPSLETRHKKCVSGPYPPYSERDRTDESPERSTVRVPRAKVLPVRACSFSARSCSTRTTIGSAQNGSRYSRHDIASRPMISAAAPTPPELVRPATSSHTAATAAPSAVRRPYTCRLVRPDDGPCADREGDTQPTLPQSSSGSRRKLSRSARGHQVVDDRPNGLRLRRVSDRLARRRSGRSSGTSSRCP